MLSKCQMIWVFLNPIVSAGIAGAAMAVLAADLNPDHVDFKHVGTIAIVGAIIGLAQHFRQSPVDQAKK